MNELKSAILESDLAKLNLLLNENRTDELSTQEVKELIKLGKDKGVAKIESALLLKYKSELDKYSKEDKEKLIISLISELSEDIYCSGWNSGIEKELWDWGNGITEPNEIFVRRVIESDAKLAVDFGNEIGFWADWNDEQMEAKTISIKEWTKKLNE
jgi:hypothetical protein